MELIIRIIISLFFSTALACLAIWKKALTKSGLLLAWVFSLVICYFGGIVAFVVLAATFIFTVLAGKLSGKIGTEIGLRLHKKTGQRDAIQILCNVLTGTIMIVLYAITKHEVFLWAYGGAMAASLADSMASEIGVLSSRQPRDILRFTPVEKGMSGGITILGLSSSLLGAIIISLLCSMFPNQDFPIVFDIAAAGFFAALCDSIIGSAFQVKYRCCICGTISEKPQHCCTACIPVCGFSFVTNDTVNIINNIIGALSSIALYFIHH